MVLITKITKILYLDSSIISLEVIVVVKSSITIAKISLSGILTSKSLLRLLNYLNLMQAYRLLKDTQFSMPKFNHPFIII